jgi:hypothetical protein
MLLPEHRWGLLCRLGFFNFGKVITGWLKFGGLRKIFGALVVIYNNCRLGNNYGLENTRSLHITHKLVDLLTVHFVNSVCLRELILILYIFSVKLTQWIKNSLSALSIDLFFEALQSFAFSCLRHHSLNREWGGKIRGRVRL